MIVQLQMSYGERWLWLTRNCRASAPGNGPYCFKGKFDKDLQASTFTQVQAYGHIENRERNSDQCRSQLDRAASWRCYCESRLFSALPRKVVVGSYVQRGGLPDSL